MSEQAPLTNWVSQQLNEQAFTLQRLAGDASFRTYYRCQAAQGNYIVMDASKETQSLGPYVAIGQLFEKSGLPVPKIYSHDLSLGYALLSDFGDTLLLGELTSDNVDHWYQTALSSLICLQKVQPMEYAFQYFDEKRILRELSWFQEWCLEKLLGMRLTDSANQCLNQTCATILEAVLAQPTCLVHLDYHSRNLMVQPGSNALGIIDFQDALIGPITYDLVSLIKDCYIAWPPDQVAKWIADFYHQCIDAGYIQASEVSLLDFEAWVDWAGLQRHLKVLGVFSRLKLRDNKDAYLKEMPRILKYILSVTKKMPQLVAFDQLLRQEIVPRFESYWAQAGIENAA